MNESTPLPDDLLDYLSAAREVEAPSADTRDRIFSRLGPLLPPSGGGSPSGDAAPSGGSDPLAGGAGAGSTASTATGGAATSAAGAASLLKGKLVVAAVSAMIGAAGGATMQAAIAPRPTVATNVTLAVAPASDRMPVTAPSTIAPETSAAPSASASSPSIEPTGVRKSSMRAERILLEAANAAIMRGDRAAAMASLQQHARLYPRGELAVERDILLSQATKLPSASQTPAPR